MATAIRTIRHEDRLSLVEHLTELRTRLIVCIAALTVVFGVCLWQNHALLNVVNRPLEKQTEKNEKKGNGTLGQTYIVDQALLDEARVQERLDRAVAASTSFTPQLREDFAAAAAQARAAIAKVPRQPVEDKPVTLGVGEPFTTTIGVCLLFSFIITLPLILFEIYGFVIPAFSPHERRVALPLMYAIPGLFAVGVLFGYFIVVPAAVRFFQNFNNTQFNVLVQAAAYYKFIGFIILAMGLVFQTPVAILGVTRAGIVTPHQLAKNRRYAIVLCAAVAAFLPGDAITLLLETLPLYILFEASVLLARIFAYRDSRREARAAAAEQRADASAPAPTASYPADADPGATGVQQMIDHVDRDLF